MITGIRETSQIRMVLEKKNCVRILKYNEDTLD